MTWLACARGHPAAPSNRVQASRFARVARLLLSSLSAKQSARDHSASLQHPSTARETHDLPPHLFFSPTPHSDKSPSDRAFFESRLRSAALPYQITRPRTRVPLTFAIGNRRMRCAEYVWPCGRCSAVDRHEDKGRCFSSIRSRRKPADRVLAIFELDRFAGRDSEFEPVRPAFAILCVSRRPVRYFSGFLHLFFFPSHLRPFYCPSV